VLAALIFSRSRERSSKTLMTRETDRRHRLSDRDLERTSVDGALYRMAITKELDSTYQIKPNKRRDLCLTPLCWTSDLTS
jgi:hypothetical protein